MFKGRRLKNLKEYYDSALLNVELESEKRFQKNALVQVRNNLSVALDRVELTRRIVQYKIENSDKLSWWDQLNLPGKRDLDELDKKISNLSFMIEEFDDAYGKSLESVKQRYKKYEDIAASRITEAYQAGKNAINNVRGAGKDADEMMRYGTWGGIFGLGASVTNDLVENGQVYDALREVNGNYSDMSDSEIWWETLFLPAESLAGLASLTKGALFEQMVADNTGGVLFEHFNHPDTDITIDGVEYQLKATDSVEYIATVDGDIPVIATSEVADAADVYDSGISNEELEEMTALAIGGSGVDTSEAIADGILGAIGGLGVFATIRGINHAVSEMDKGIEKSKALDEGLMIALEGSTKTLVNTAELVLTSRPSRFVGRVLLGAAMKLDKKLFGSDEK